MTDLGKAARRLLAGEPGDGQSSKQIAERATQACERLAKHMSRLLGDAGIQMLFARSIVLASAQLPWLPSSTEPATASSALREAMEQQEPESIAEAFVTILSAFVGLMKRLIGDGLVDRLLDEVWPSVFVHAVKDTP